MTRRSLGDLDMRSRLIIDVDGNGRGRAEYPSRWRLVCAWITMYVVGADLFIISPLLPRITSDLHASTSHAGWLVSAFSVAYALFSPLVGNLSDKYGRRAAISFGMLLFAAANFITACAVSFAAILASRVLAGTAVSAISPSIYAAMGDQAPEGSRAHWISIAVSGLLTALWTSAPLGVLLAHIMPWRFVFILLSTSALLLAWPNCLLWPASSIHKSTSTTHRIPLPIAMLAVSPMIAWGAALYGLYTYLGIGLGERGGISVSFASMCFVGWGVGAIFGNQLGGWAADRFGPDRTAVWSLVGMMSSMSMFGLCLQLRYGAAWLVIALFVLATLCYPFQPAQQTRLMQLNGLHKTSLLAWNSSALYVGMTIGSVLYGYVMKKWLFPSLPFMGAVIAGLAIVLSLLSQRLFRFPSLG